jgi:hypothetical protein
MAVLFCCGGIGHVVFSRLVHSGVSISASCGIVGTGSARDRCQSACDGGEREEGRIKAGDLKDFLNGRVQSAGKELAALLIELFADGEYAAQAPATDVSDMGEIEDEESFVLIDPGIACFLEVFRSIHVNATTDADRRDAIDLFAN